MNLFTAQKHASFAAKLFSAAGFDFSAALAANDAAALKTHLAAQSPAVAALFSNAGLDLDTLLAAGPESLKAHLASLDNAGQVASLSLELATAKSALETKAGEITALEASLAARTSILSALGIAEMQTADTPAAIKAAFESHVAKQTTLALAKTGHPPAHVPVDTTAATASVTDESLAAEYEKLPRGDEKTAFFHKHEAALWRVHVARSTARD